jgi:hypothetical protein
MMYTLSGFTELLLTQLQNQGQMNFTVRLCFFRNQDLTGKVSEDIFVPSLEQTRRRSIGGPIVKKQIILLLILKLIKVIQVQIL